MQTVNDAEVRSRIRRRVAEEREANPLTWFYLSFADGTLPKGTQFLGAVIVRAHGMGDAVQQAHRRGINPGGEVLGVDAGPDFDPPAAFVNRLLARADVTAMDRAMGYSPKETT